MFNEPGNGQTIVTWTATLTLVGSNPPTTVTSGYAVQTPTTTLTTLTFTAPPAAGTYDIQVSAVEGSSTLATSATSTADRLTVD